MYIGERCWEVQDSWKSKPPHILCERRSISSNPLYDDNCLLGQLPGRSKIRLDSPRLDVLVSRKSIAVGRLYSSVFLAQLLLGRHRCSMPAELSPSRRSMTNPFNASVSSASKKAQSESAVGICRQYPSLTQWRQWWMVMFNTQWWRCLGFELVSPD